MMPDSERLATVQNDFVRASLDQLGLRARSLWQQPTGKLDVTVTTNGAVISGQIRLEGQDLLINTIVNWYAANANVSGPIERVRRAANAFRVDAQDYLNDIEPIDLARRLQKFVPQEDWSALVDMSDRQHQVSWNRVRDSDHLRDLAKAGYGLYQRFFPQHSELRTWLDGLPRGHRLDVTWQNTTQAWVPSVPWALMYMEDPSDTTIEPMHFMGLRLRIAYWSHATAPVPRILAHPTDTYCMHFMYWGTGDVVADEAEWQRARYSGWTNHMFVPNPATANPRQEVLGLLSTPGPVSARVLHVFCRSGEVNGVGGLLFDRHKCDTTFVAISALPQSRLVERPLVFVNACSTAGGDAMVVNEFLGSFFDRGCRAFLGSEIRIPVQLASRFAAVFFHFLCRKAVDEPITAGEALVQTRLFLWAEFKNIGGLLYSYVNDYDVYVATEDEIAMMRD
jgi:CHAT domain